MLKLFKLRYICSGAKILITSTFYITLVALESTIFNAVIFGKIKYFFYNKNKKNPLQNPTQNLLTHLNQTLLFPVVYCLPFFFCFVLPSAYCTTVITIVILFSVLLPSSILAHSAIVFDAIVYFVFWIFSLFFLSQKTTKSKVCEYILRLCVERP